MGSTYSPNLELVTSSLWDLHISIVEGQRCAFQIFNDDILLVHFMNCFPVRCVHLYVKLPCIVPDETSASDS